MKDVEIIELFFSRSENAIQEIKDKYGSYIRKISYNILDNQNDMEEVESDVYMAVWNAIPPERPGKLKHYLSRVARNLALKKYEYNKADKRRNNTALILDELAEMLPSDSNIEEEIEAKEIGSIVNAYVSDLSEWDKVIFICRYFYIESIKEIAEKKQVSERHIKYRLSVMRKELKEKLTKEGYTL